MLALEQLLLATVEKNYYDFGILQFSIITFWKTQYEFLILIYKRLLHTAHNQSMKESQFKQGDGLSLDFLRKYYIYIYLLRDSLFFNLDLKVVCSTVEKANEGHSQRSKCKTSQPCSVTIEAACEGV